MDILIPDIMIIDEVARSLVVSGFLLVAFREAVKRQLGQLTAFDPVVLLIISHVRQNAAIGNDRSPGGRLPGTFAIIAVGGLVAWVMFRHRRLQPMVENVLTVLSEHGHVLHGTLGREHMRMAELRAAFRQTSIATISEIRYAILEENGPVSVIPRSVQPA
jgi:uncharacterized membrane protein YcaP (DUF421 family)